MEYNHPRKRVGYSDTISNFVDLFDKHYIHVAEAPFSRLTFTWRRSHIDLQCQRISEIRTQILSSRARSPDIKEPLLIGHRTIVYEL
jgi:hypothetical protein